MNDPATLTGQFAADGYVRLVGAIPCDLIAELSNLLEEELRFLESMKDSEAALLEDGVSLHELEGGNVRRKTKSHKLFWEVIKRSEILKESLYQLLNTDSIFMHMYPTPRLIRPLNAEGLVPPHYDKLYNEHLNNFVTVWIPIDAFEEGQGGVNIWPGSHNKEFIKPPKNGLWLQSLDIKDEEKKELVLEMGDCIIMHERTVHESRNNYSPRVRKSIDMRFFGSKTDTTKHYLDCTTWKVQPPSPKYME